MYGAVFGFVKVKFGLHQGSVLSSLLFIIVLDALSQEIRRFQLTWNRVSSLSVFTRKRVYSGPRQP